MLVKSAPVKVKGVGEEDGLKAGQVRAVVSVFGNVDSYGDIVLPGAFTETLKDWEASGNPIPVLYSHDSRDPNNNVGYVVEAKETDEGLECLMQLDVDSDTGNAKQVHRLLLEKRLTQFSFAYDLLEYAEVKTEAGQWVWELRKLKLFEVGPCLIGANQETRLIGAKHDQSKADLALAQIRSLTAEVKAGRVLSSENEKRVRDAIASLLELIDQLPTDDAGKSAPNAMQARQDLLDLMQLELDAIDCD